MRYRQYGNTQLKVSEMCFGTMRYASKEGIPDDTSKAGKQALEEAIEQGINFIHSSYEYGTRWLTGDVLKNHPKRHEFHHIIKVNVPDWGEPRFEEPAFRKQIEDALRELHADQIAVVQHLQRGKLDRALGYCQEGEPQRINEFQPVLDDLLAAFSKLREEGKVQYLATFPYTVGYARRAIESGAFSGVVAYFDVLETEMLDLFPLMKEKGMGFIGIRPLAAGLLSNRRIDRSSLPEGDRFREEQWDRFYDQLNEFRSTLSEEPDSWSEFALRFALADPLITSNVVSINNTEQLHTALNAVSGTYPDEKILQAAHRINTSYREKFGVKANAAGVPIY